MPQHRTTSRMDSSVATAAAVAAAGILHRSLPAPHPVLGPRTPRPACAHRRNKRRRSSSRRQGGSLWAHMVSSQQIADAHPAPTATIHATPQSPATRPPPTRRQGHAAGGLQGSSAGVHVRLHQLRRRSLDEGGVTHAAVLRARYGLRPRSGGRYDDGPGPARRRHRRARDTDSQFGQRLRGLRLRRVRPRQHRPDPAGHVHLRPEGGER